ncbi:MAG TPA: SRPBCC domain-containing protein [Gammaproteobacteria bacterium]|nr:SRPBCC domain-containing protein [Gammaproteobacteria bacterium]
MSKTTFRKDEKPATLTIERVFPASIARVWQALTDPAILDQWWGPAPWKVQTVHMDFRVGGYWHYAMKGPDGSAHHGRMDYLEIEPKTRFKSSDVFCDADGNVIESLPRQDMDMRFIAEDETTRLVSMVQYASVEDMDRILEMGMQEGFTIAQDQLEALLAAASRL